MALRDQPYLPLYVQDFMTDEKLSECSALATGVYIRLMCLMHKSEEYGCVLLKQKDKQSDKQILNFACKVAKNMPYDVNTIESALAELIEESVLTIDGDMLIQKRMVRDCKLSEKRAFAGKNGGIKSSKKEDFAQAKVEANTEAKAEANSEYEIEYEIENKDETDLEREKGSGKGKTFEPPTIESVKLYFDSLMVPEIEADKFMNFYQSKGWMVGKTKMKDWQASARGWAIRRKYDKSESSSQVNNPKVDLTFERSEIAKMNTLKKFTDGKGETIQPLEIRAISH